MKREISNPNNIRIGGVIYGSLVNGKGIRDVIFTSGCTHNCAGCHNTKLQDFKYGKEYPIDAVAEKLIRNSVMSDGITISGGDPLDQYEASLKLCKELKNKKTGINIWLYTGYTYEEIIENGFDEILSYIDAIVDGEFVAELKSDDCKYRGSSNQRIIYIEDITTNNQGEQL